MDQIVALLTDFGLQDPFIGQIKGAILARASGCQFIDVCHDVPPFRLEQAGFFLQASSSWMPRGTVFLAVVDPGVGTERRIVCLVKGGRTYLAPDNGLLSLILANPGVARAFDLSEHAQGEEISSTFHGRDVFAPLAAQLILGERPEDLGYEIPADSLVRLPWSAPVLDGDSLAARVLHVDRFGNVILNAANEPWHKRLLALGPLSVASPKRMALIPAEAYAELAPDRLGLFRGSQGYLELAAGRASAATLLGVQPGDGVVLAAGVEPSSPQS